jgi:hypothetical protein
MPTEVPNIDDFSQVAQWLKKCNVAGSALGRQICGDHSLCSRWKHDPRQVSVEKRQQVILFIRTHPEGLPGYQGRGHRRKRVYNTGGHGGPRDVDRVGHQPKEGGPSTVVPVPALSELHKEDDTAWVKARAFSKGISIAQVLADMVELGILVTKETENEE